MFKALRLLLVALPLAACQSTGSNMRAMAPSVSALSFVSVHGPDAAMAKKFEGILTEEAKRKGFSVGSGLQVKTFLDSYVTEGKTGYSWVIDASPDGRLRAARAKGTAMLGAATPTPWASFDEAAMRQVARMGLDDLAHQLQANGGTASEPTAEEQ